MKAAASNSSGVETGPIPPRLRQCAKQHVASKRGTISRNRSASPASIPFIATVTATWRTCWRNTRMRPGAADIQTFRARADRVRKHVLVCAQCNAWLRFGCRTGRRTELGFGDGAACLVRGHGSLPWPLGSHVAVGPGDRAAMPMRSAGCVQASSALGIPGCPFGSSGRKGEDGKTEMGNGQRCPGTCQLPCFSPAISRVMTVLCISSARTGHEKIHSVQYHLAWT